MSNEKSEFSFETQKTEEENRLLVKIYVVAMPNAKPQILVELFSILQDDGDISSLIKKFLQYSKELKKLQEVLAQGKINKEQTTGLYYSQVFSWAIHTLIELPPTSQPPAK